MSEFSRRCFRILFVDHTPFAGGAQLALVRHLRYLDRSYFTPVILCSSSVPKLVEKFQQAGVKVFTVPFGRLKVFPLVALGRLLVTAWRLGKVGRQEEVNLIVANSERAFYPALLVSFLAGKKLILWVRDFEYPRFLLGFFGRLVAKFVFVSRAVRDYYQGQAYPKAAIVYVGTDLFCRPEGSAGLRAKWGLKRDAIAIGFAGRLVSWKGAQIVLQAAKMLKGEHFLDNRWKVIIAGEGYGQEGENTQELKDYVRRHSLEQTIEFVGFQEEPDPFYAALDIFVHPSLKPEPFATVVVEALAAGLPVVAAAAGGTLEVIKDGENGLFFPLGDAVALAEKLKRLLSDEALRRRLGAAARRTVQQSFTEGVVTRQMEDIYREVLELSRFDNITWSHYNFNKHPGQGLS